MKKYWNSEGYTLITVLLIIVIISMFALTLIPKALSTAVQVNKGEEMSQTKDLAEMGVSYTHALLQNKVQLAINDVKNDPNFTKENHNTLFCKKIKPRLADVSFLKSPPTVETITMTNSNYKYSIEKNGAITINAADVTQCSGFEDITIPITSVGYVGDEEKELQAIFTIQNGGTNLVINPGNGGTPQNPDLLPLEIINRTVDLSGNDREALYSSPRFTQFVTLRGNGFLSIGGNAWFQGKNNNNKAVVFRGSNGKLLVSGNAYFSGDIELNGNGNNFICVRGTSYQLRNNNWVEMDQQLRNDLCPPNIWEEVKDDFFYDINDWMIMDIDVTY